MISRYLSYISKLIHRLASAELLTFIVAVWDAMIVYCSDTDHVVCGVWSLWAASGDSTSVIRWFTVPGPMTGWQSPARLLSVCVWSGRRWEGECSRVDGCVSSMLMSIQLFIVLLWCLSLARSAPTRACLTPPWWTVIAGPIWPTAADQPPTTLLSCVARATIEWTLCNRG